MITCPECKTARVAFACFNKAFYAKPANLASGATLDMAAGYTEDDLKEIASKDIDADCFVCLDCCHVWRTREKT